MPDCAARFETNDRDQLLDQVASHAAEAHGITDITPAILQAVEGKIVVAA